MTCEYAGGEGKNGAGVGIGTGRVEGGVGDGDGEGNEVGGLVEQRGYGQFDACVVTDPDVHPTAGTCHADALNVPATSTGLYAHAFVYSHTCPVPSTLALPNVSITCPPWQRAYTAQWLSLIHI